MSVEISNDTANGSVTLKAQDVATGNIIATLPDFSCELAPRMVLSTVKATTSGTFKDFSVPSWAKKITVMFDSLSTNGLSVPIIQLGSTVVKTTGYVGGVDSTTSVGSTPSSLSSGLGFGRAGVGASGSIYCGNAVLTKINQNNWTGTLQAYVQILNSMTFGAASVALSGTLDILRITTANGTDTFDGGSVNILIEG